MPINCAALPETLIESELFGHERGAFTGAVERKTGLFEVATRGTVFLDEIGELSLPLQSRLLRVLETQEFFRVGGTRAVRVDVRIVSATNRDIRAEVEAGRFREDLFYRLNGVAFRVPPLRERRGDIPLLARHFLDRGGSGRMLEPAALEALASYDWPGNVRELEMVIGRAALLSPGPGIGAEDLPLEVRPRAAPRVLRTDLTLAEMEKEYVQTVLDKNRGHRARTAEALGIDPKTLYNKLRAWGVVAEEPYGGGRPAGRGRGPRLQQPARPPSSATASSCCASSARRSAGAQSAAGDPARPRERAAALTRQLLAFSRQADRCSRRCSTSNAARRGDARRCSERLIGEDIELVVSARPRPRAASRPTRGRSSRCS